MTIIKSTFFLQDDFHAIDKTGILNNVTLNYLTYEELNIYPELISAIKAYRYLISTCINWDNPGDETWGKQFTPNYFKLIRELREEIVLYMQKKGFDIL
jgi:hypothetical protein